MCARARALAIKWSFLVLAATAALQLVVVFVSHSVALLADTIHNIADAGTAIPLWVAFLLARRKPTQTFTYGYGRVEDFAGLAIVLIILFSALVAGYEAIVACLEARAARTGLLKTNSSKWEFFSDFAFDRPKA